MLPGMSLEALVAELRLPNNISQQSSASTNFSYAASFYYYASFLERIGVEYYKDNS